MSNPYDDHIIKAFKEVLKYIVFGNTIYCVLTEKNRIFVFNYSHQLLRVGKASNIVMISLSMNE